MRVRSALAAAVLVAAALPLAAPAVAFAEGHTAAPVAQVKADDDPPVCSFGPDNGDYWFYFEDSTTSSDRRNIQETGYWLHADGQRPALSRSPSATTHQRLWITRTGRLRPVRLTRRLRVWNSAAEAWS